ncbi:MAG TPA: zf-TFIIB domain-containing protein [Tepidisphaeraceae bacterium]|nr:zf-TFIIB domain-containing protein [Tepidisphaeraceae bacterium]
MKCPACSTTDLIMSDRHGIEIDYCPKCRGVWLDRGELDKIIERAAAHEQSLAVQQPSAPHPQQPPRREPRLDDSDYGYTYQEPRHRKRKSFWSELFD